MRYCRRIQRETKFQTHETNRKKNTRETAMNTRRIISLKLCFL